MACFQYSQMYCMRYEVRARILWRLKDLYRVETMEQLSTPARAVEHIQ